VVGVETGSGELRAARPFGSPKTAGQEKRNVLLITRRKCGMQKPNVIS